MSTPTAALVATGPVPAPVDDSHMIWRELTSKNGKKIRVGYTKHTEDSDGVAPSVEPSPAAPAAPDVALNEQEKTETAEDGRIHKQWAPFQVDCDVHWEYHDGVYYYPAPQVKFKIDITEYQLGWNHFGYYDYKLQIKCDVAWKYTFHDEEGDSYGLNCEVTGWHSVCYDSTAPTIIRVHAERWNPPPLLPS